MTLFAFLKNADDFYKVFWPKKNGSIKLPGGGVGVLSFFLQT